MSNEKLMPANVGIWAARPEAFADPTNPTVAELNNAALVYNVSCAIEDGYTLNQTGSDTDDSRTICDEGEVSSPTFENAEASLDGFRSRSLTDVGVFNLFFRLFKAPGVPYILIKRIGKHQDEPFVAGDIISLFGVETDNPTDIVDDVTNIMFGARFKPTGVVAVKREVVA